jgi:hypothetical protein
MDRSYFILFHYRAFIQHNKIIQKQTKTVFLCISRHLLLLLLLSLLLFILTANGFLPGGSDYTIRRKKQITHITQNNTTIKRNTAHKTTHTIMDTLHRRNINNHNYNYIN